MGNRRRLLWFACAGVTLLALVIVLRPKPREPVINGKPLSVWVSNVRFEGPGFASLILQRAEPDAVPYLVRWLSIPRSAAADAVWTRLNSACSVFPYESHSTTLAVGARDTLVLMGHRAQSGIPLLARLLTDPSTPTWNRDMIAGAFPRIPESWAPLLLALSSADSTTRHYAATAIRFLPPATTNSQETISILLSSVKDADPEIVVNAIDGLGKFPQDFTRIMPALEDELHSTNNWEQLAAVNALARMGTNAQGVAPDLLVMAHDTNQRMLAIAAQAALLEIAPGTTPELDPKSRQLWDRFGKPGP